MRRGGDADFKDKMSKKNKELSEYLDEIRVWLTVWDMTKNVVPIILCFVNTENGYKKRWLNDKKLKEDHIIKKFVQKNVRYVFGYQHL